MERQRDTERDDTEQDELERADELRALARLLGGGEQTAQRPRAEDAGRFELVRLLGAGPHGQVFLACDREQQGRELCLKRLWPELSARAHLAERLEELGRRLHALRRAGFVRLLGVTRDSEGRLLIASERSAGESLAELIARRGALAPRHALEIARQVLELCEHAQAHGLSHGHLCAENVRLASRVPWSEENPFGVGVELADHGLAALLGEPASAARDLFELARLLAALVTGTRLAPDAEDWAAARAAVRASDVRALLDRALDPRAERRFPDAASWRRALERSPSWLGAPAHLAFLRAGFVGLAALALVLLGLFLRARLSGPESARAAELERDLARLELELHTRAEAAHALACAALDRFLESLEEGDLAEADAVLAGARAAPELAPLGFATGFLEAGLETSRHLAAAGGGQDAFERARDLLAARGALRAGREAREAFRLRAAAWLALDLPPRPARQEDCLRWFASLQRELEQRSSVLESALEERWDALTRADTGPAGDGLRAALTLAAWFADERVERWAERLADHGSAADEALAECLRLLVRPAVFPGAVGTTRLYREREASGAERWILVTVQSGEEGNWRLEERSFAADGTGETRRELTLEREGTRYGERGPPGRPWFDLAEVPPALSTFDPGPAPVVPDLLGFPAAALDRFHAGLATRALMLHSDLGTLWISARLGLLRTRAADGRERELVYAPDG